MKQEIGIQNIAVTDHRDDGSHPESFTDTSSGLGLARRSLEILERQARSFWAIWQAAAHRARERLRGSPELSAERENRRMNKKLIRL